MKRVFKFFAMKIIVIAFCLFGASSIFAQDLVKECETLYNQFLIQYHGDDIDKIKKIAGMAKEYLEKCGDLKGNEAVKAYLIKQIPRVEQRIKEIEVGKIVARFNSAVPAKNWDEAFAAGKEIIAKDPKLTLDISLILASIGYENTKANPPVNKYNDEAINYAKSALQQIHEGKTSLDYGTLVFPRKSSKCPDGKVNATGWMNYIIGYIMYYRRNQKTEALPYLKSSTETGCETKTFHETYRLIGAWYLEEAVKSSDLRSQRLRICFPTEPPTSESKEEYNSILAKEKDYLKKALNAYKTAYKCALRKSNVLQDYKKRLRLRIENLSNITEKY
jgi:hypothetical protein